MQNRLKVALLFGLFVCHVPWLSASEIGEQLYLQHCSACHGNDGDGGVGVPLALDDFQSSVSDAYLNKTIRLGRPGRIMPAFTQFSDAEVAAIVKHIRSFSRVAHPDDDRTPIKGNPEHGKNIFEKNCAACHGKQGQGGQGTGVTFSRPRNQPIIAPALNNPGFLAAASDNMIKRTLMQGRRGTPMISFIKKGLSDSDLNDVISYIRSFEKLPHKQKHTDAAPTIIYESPYSVQETVESIKRAVVGKNFRLIRVQTLDDGYVDKDRQNHKKMIVYFCNFEFLNRALGIDPRVGMFLPCRITVVEKNGKVLVMAINPLRLSHFFNNNELDRACDEMRNLYIEILEEATL
ncbi:MAG: c-type cytochrome [Thioalkalispiraceae bacterium]|jgi:cytochrome c oxidase cbb3-type subunit 3